MRLFKILLCLAAVLSCQTLYAEPAAEMAVTYERTQVQAPSCEGPECPEVTFDVVRFVGLPKLDQYVDHELLKQAYREPGQADPSSLEAYQKQFLAEAKPGWSSLLHSNVLGQHIGLVVLALSSYNFTGGANGESGLSYLHYERSTERWLSLPDFFIEGQEPAFWQLVQQAHQQWLQTNKFDQDASFTETWPFSRTDNVAFLEAQVVLSYPVGQLGPNYLGNVQLSINYDKLHGIVKPQFIPPSE